MRELPATNRLGSLMLLAALKPGCTAARGLRGLFDLDFDLLAGDLGLGALF